MTDNGWAHLPDDFFDRPIEEQVAELSRPDLDPDLGADALERTKNLLANAMLDSAEAVAVLSAIMGNPNMPFDRLVFGLGESTYHFYEAEWPLVARLVETFADNPAWPLVELTGEVGSHAAWGDLLTILYRKRNDSLGARALGFPMLLPHEYEGAREGWRQGALLVREAIFASSNGLIDVEDQLDLVRESASEAEVGSALLDIAEAFTQATNRRSGVPFGTHFAVSGAVLRVHVPEEKYPLLLPMFSERARRFSLWQPEVRS